jgi:hypothetical protein
MINKQEVIKAVIEKNGCIEQIDMIHEEFGEFMQAINKVKRMGGMLEGETIAKPHKETSVKYSLMYFGLCAEVADVKIMLSQLEFMMCSDIDEYITSFSPKSVTVIKNYLQVEIGNILSCLNTIILNGGINENNISKPDSLNFRGVYNTAYNQLQKSITNFKYLLSEFENHLDKEAIAISEERKLIRLKNRIEAK